MWLRCYIGNVARFGWRRWPGEKHGVRLSDSIDQELVKMTKI